MKLYQNSDAHARTSLGFSQVTPLDFAGDFEARLGAIQRKSWCKWRKCYDDGGTSPIHVYRIFSGNTNRAKLALSVAANIMNLTSLTVFSSAFQGSGTPPNGSQKSIYSVEFLFLEISSIGEGF